MRNCPTKPIAGPTGRFKFRIISPQFRAQPKLIYKMLTKVATDDVKTVSMTRFLRITVTSNFPEAPIHLTSVFPKLNQLKTVWKSAKIPRKFPVRLKIPVWFRIRNLFSILATLGFSEYSFNVSKFSSG